MNDDDNAYSMYTNPYPASNKLGQPRDWTSKRQRWERDAAQAATDAVYANMNRDGRMHMSLAWLHRELDQWAQACQDVADARAEIERAATFSVQMLEIGQFPERLMPRLALALRAHYGDQEAQDSLNRAAFKDAAEWKETRAHGTHGDHDGRGNGGA